MIKPLVAIRLIWFALAVMALVFGAIAIGSSSGAPEAYRVESLMLPALLLLMLSFPAGLIWLAIVIVASRILTFDLSSGGVNGFLAEWIGVVVLGYLQWFWLMPRLVGWWRRRGNSRPSR